MLESLWEIDEQTNTRVGGTIPASDLFYYQDKEFQRGIHIDSVVLLLRYPVPMDPFTNLPMDPQVVEQAKQEVSRRKLKPPRLTKQYKLMLSMDKIIDSFYILGFTVERRFVECRSNDELFRWLWECINLAFGNLVPIPLTFGMVYQTAILPRRKIQEAIMEKIVEIVDFSPVCVVVALTALCRIDAELRGRFPTIFE